MFAAEESFESVAKFGFDGVVGFLAAPDADAGTEIVDCDEHEDFSELERMESNGDSIRIRDFTAGARTLKSGV